MPTDRRRNLGAAGEQLAADHLVRRGFLILERNFRTRLGELDIVACDARTIVFCEVKTRVAGRAGPIRDPLESVHPRKRLQVRRLAVQWLAGNPDRPRAADLRFDAIGITLTAEGELLRLDHVEGAF
jgi:putative endonuclease